MNIAHCPIHRRGFDLSLYFVSQPLSEWNGAERSSASVNTKQAAGAGSVCGTEFVIRCQG